MENNRITKAVLGRLPQYLSFLEDISNRNVPFISATKIAKELSLGEVLVRKDLNMVCGKGRPKLGYRTDDLLKSIKSYLRCGDATPAVLVGAGKLGKALLGYDGFEEYGVRIAAAFDCSEQVLTTDGSPRILPMSEFGDFCKNNEVQIGIITVGAQNAQDVCRQMLENGITAIWNFAPCKLNVPEGILFRQENLAVSLAYLNSQLLNRRRKEMDE